MSTDLKVKARAFLTERIAYCFEEDGLCDELEDDIDALVALLREVDASARAERDGELLRRFLSWRGLGEDFDVTPCKACGGAGSRAYGSTATWHGGAGGQMVTSGVCDKCWGSGDASRPWMNLRRIDALLTRLRSEYGGTNVQAIIDAALAATPGTAEPPRESKP